MHQSSEMAAQERDIHTMYESLWILGKGCMPYSTLIASAGERLVDFASREQRIG